MKGFTALLVGIVMTIISAQLCAAEVPLGKEYLTLDKRIQTLKAAVLSLGQDIALLEKGVASTGNPLIIYLTTDLDDAYDLQAVEFEINGNFVGRQEFLPESIRALKQGGALRLFSKDLPPGEYTVKATMTGIVGKGKPYNPQTRWTFTKEKKSKIVEFRVQNVRERFLPEFNVTEWN